jgi:hypothetical protein
VPAQDDCNNSISTSVGNICFSSMICVAIKSKLLVDRSKTLTGTISLQPRHQVGATILLSSSIATGDLLS